MIVLGADGRREVMATVASFPMCTDFLPDGQLLVVDSTQRRLLRREPGGSLVTHADLSWMSAKPWNDVVVDDEGNAYVNTIGFDFPGGEYAPSLVVLATPDGGVRQVAGDVAFPNGMAITPDGRTLILAESYASRLTAYGISAASGLGSRPVASRSDASIRRCQASARWFPRRARLRRQAAPRDQAGITAGVQVCAASWVMTESYRVPHAI